MMIRAAFHALRQLKRAPGFSLAIILTFALGIGANTAIFSFVHALLVRPFPFADPERLVQVYSWNGSDKGRLSLQEVADLNQRASLFEGFAAYRDSGYNYGGDYAGGDGGPAEHIIITMATSNLFHVLGAEPSVGATWPAGDDRSRCFDIVLTNDLWKRRFRSDPNIVGKQVLMDGFPNTVTGVAPAGITFPYREGLFRCWGISSNPQSYAERQRRNASVVGRLRRGVTIEQGRSEIAAIGDRLAREFPATNSRVRFDAAPLRDAYMGDVRPYLLILLGAVGLLLLVACANVANLLLARAAGRQREMAIRAALGAGRGELVRQSLAESLVHSCVGGAIGVAIAYAALPVLTKMITVELPSWMAVRIDGAVLLFALGVVLLTSVLAGLLPAIRGARYELQQALRQGAAGSTRHGSALGPMVTSEVAIATLLLMGAGLMLQSLSRLMNVDLGFRTDHTFTFEMGLSWRKYNYERARDLQTRVLERLKQIPGVTDAAMDTMLPLNGYTAETAIQLDGQLGQDIGAAPISGVHQVSANYHRLMGIRLIEGRLFEDRDHPASMKVAIVSRKLARRLSPERSILGVRVLPRDRFGPGAQEWLTIVGVVDDVRHNGPASDAPLDLYVPYLQTGSQGSSFVVRTDLPAKIIHREALRAVASVDPGEPPNDLLMMDEALSRKIWQRRLAGVVFSILAGLALSLAGIGIYGVIAYSVSQRVREIGIRSALGARRADIVRMVVLQGARFVLPGIALGIAAGLLLGRPVQSLLFQISPHDPATLAIVVGVECVIACCACIIPAARAARMDPLSSLRSD
jgi:putative ABC transport system permease protein